MLFLQNHDQIGNRAFGERLHQLANPEALKAATALLLLSPMIPLMFMGDEFAAEQPFLFFTSHHGELAELVREGRRNEFAAFSAFADPDKREQIPDPNAPRTFEASRPTLTADPTIGHARACIANCCRSAISRSFRACPAPRPWVPMYWPRAPWRRAGDWAMAVMLRIDLNLGNTPVVHTPQADAKVLFEHPPTSADLLDQGTLAPYCALVSLTAAAPLLPPDGERQ